jgi:competence protein ComEA
MAAGLERYSHAIIIALAALLVAAVIALAIREHERRQPLELTFDGTPAAGGPIEVYITGAVAQPGVYEMAAGDRAIDLLYKAGGPAADADLEAANLALLLHDEDRVVVPRTGQAGTSEVAGAQSPAVVNINAASAAELDALPGIGEVYSRRIVDSRTTAGPFATTDDLVNRDVIPRATYEKIRDLITAGP